MLCPFLSVPPRCLGLRERQEFEVEFGKTGWLPGPGFPSHLTGVCASVLVTQAPPAWDEQCFDFLPFAFARPTSDGSLLR